MRDLPRVVADTPVGKDVEVIVVRKGKELKKIPLIEALQRSPYVRLLDSLEPTLIEVGDAFHPAWCARHVAIRRHFGRSLHLTGLLKRLEGLLHSSRVAVHLRFLVAKPT